LFSAVVLAQGTSAKISGQIEGMPPVEVLLTLESPPRTIFSTRLDDGRFKFTVLPAGIYSIKVAIAGFKTLNVKSIRLDDGEDKVLPPLAMEVAPSDTPWLPIPGFDLRATNPQFGNLSSRVTRDEIHGIARAKVQLICDDKICAETHTDTDGKFIFFNLPPRDDYGIRVIRPGYYTWQWADYRVQAGYDVTYDPIVVRRLTKLSRAASTVR
jgi:Carboxypeptidase regulatory-like domain